jgi:prevent-host-death family protein
VADLSELDEDEVGIRYARSNLTELVNRVRLLKQVKFLTNRERRVAAIVPIEYYERAEKAFALLAEHPQLAERVDGKS